MTYWDAIVQVLSNAITPAPVTIMLFFAAVLTFVWAAVRVDYLVDLLWFLVPIVLVILLASLVVYTTDNAIGPWSWAPGSADW